MFLKSDDQCKKELIPGIIALIVIPVYNALVFSLRREDLIALTREDGIVENTAATCYLVSAFILFLLSTRAKAINRTNFPGFIDHIFYIVLAVAMIVFAGEEISWGQRLFDFNIPGFWENANRQGEANLHNLNFWDALDTSGSKKHGIMRLFSSSAIFSYFWLTIFIIGPIINRYWSSANDYFKTKGIPAFNMLYGLLFIGNFLALEYIERTGIELRPVGEVKETNFAVLYLAASISMLINTKSMKRISLNG